MSVLCTGSVAVDHIMVFGGRFKDVILPDKIHVLNVAFHVPELKRSFGGTAANIAFQLKILGTDPVLLATVGGDDFAAYAEWLDAHGVDRRDVRGLAGESTAGAYITTDLDDNQITGFHPGAMDRAHEATVASVNRDFGLGIVSPNGKQAMIDHAKALKEGPAQCIVDPGQGLPLFDQAELTDLLTGADLYIVNDYEWELTTQTTGLSQEEVLERVGTLIVTGGEKGSTVSTREGSLDIPVVKAAQVVDPTGCGDAFRAGLLHGLDHGFELEAAARLGSVMGSFLVEYHGTQTDAFTLEDVHARHREAFGGDPGAA